MKCPSCGAINAEGLVSCEFCDTKFSAAKIIGTDDYPTSPPSGGFLPTVEQSVNPPNISAGQPDKRSLDATELAAGLPNYYAQAFEEFSRSGASGLRPKFNVGAFFFGPFWYLYRGLWAKALIYLAVSFGSGGLAVLIPWVYSAMFGTYDLYLLRKDKKQLW